MVLDRLVLCHSVSTISNLLRCFDSDLSNYVIIQSFKLISKYLRSFSPLIESSLQICFHIACVVFHKLELVLDQFSDSYKTSPSIPNCWQKFPGSILVQSNSFNIFFHQMVVSSKHSVTCGINLFWGVMFLIHKFFEIVNLSHC